MKLMRQPPALRLLLAGDLCPIHRVERLLAAGDARGAFGGALALFRQADISVVNLEAPLCRGGRPIAKLGPNFKSDPRVARALRAAGVDVCCLANNHIMDQGAAGLKETLRHLDAAGLRRVGAAEDPADAAAPLRLSANGVRLALLNFAIVEGALGLEGPGAARIDPLAVRRALARELRRIPVVIPILHAGREEVLLPSPGLRDLCRELVEAGAAAVVCHHPHVPQGIEIHAGRPIAYSLGNFLFDWPEPEPHTDSSFLFELGLVKAGVARVALHPFRKSATGGAERLRGRACAEYRRFIRDISAPLRRAGEYRRLWTEQCRPQLAAYYAKRLARGADFGSKDPAARRKAQLTFLNAIERLEHGEVIQEAVRARLTGRGATDRPARRTLDAWTRRLVKMGQREERKTR